MAGKIKEMIDAIIQARAKGNAIITEMTKSKFIMKGIDPDKYDADSPDHPETIGKLLEIVRQFNESNRDEQSNNIKSVFSLHITEESAVADIKHQLQGFDARLVVYFAAPGFQQAHIGTLMQEAFRNSLVFGCSTAGEISGGVLLKNSLVAMAFNSNVVADVKAEVLENISESLNLETAFLSFERYFKADFFNIDATRYVGILLVDGVSMAEERLMDQIGNRTNVYFIGGSAGDDLKFEKTFVSAKGKTYSNAAVLAILKISDYAKFDIIKTQSFRVTERTLVATKVDKAAREVIEFNHKPAIMAYAEAVGATSEEEAVQYFAIHPLGLVGGDHEIFIRSPRQVIGTRIKFFCSLLEGMEVRVLEPTDIIADTQRALEQKTRELGRIDGIVQFNCIERAVHLSKMGLTRQYGELFSQIQTAGFSSYGEQYIGHMNQTATMLVFKCLMLPFNTGLDVSTPTEISQKYNFVKQIYEELVHENYNLRTLVREQSQHLQEITLALKEFNDALNNEINERTKREEEIRYLSYHDTLTGLYNRRFYEETIRRMDIEGDLPISVIMGDANSLKYINDNFGHAKGDELLQKTAAGILAVCREDDIAARWGGDEFVILLPQTDRTQAEHIAMEIKNLCAKKHVNGIPVSISFGWDTKEDREVHLLGVLANAERAMYQNKSQDKLEAQGVETT